jgi:hypothetical protein
MRFAPCRAFEHATDPTPTAFATAALRNGSYRASVGSVSHARKSCQCRYELEDCSDDGINVAIEELP